MHGSSLHYDDNTGYMILDELRDSEGVEGIFISNATVSLVDIRNKATMVVVTGATFPIAMPYVTGTDGKYRCKVPETLASVPGQTYEAHVSVLSGSDVGHFYLVFPAKKRTV